MKSSEFIVKRITEIGDGVIFGYEDLRLPADMQYAAAMTLCRMVANNQLRKVGKGRFYKPKVSRFGEMPPMPEQLLKDLLVKDGKLVGYITGVPVFAQMGLTTQVSSKILIGSAQYHRPLQRGGYMVAYTRQPNEITEMSIPILRILDAIKFIKEIPATTVEEAIVSIKNIIGQLSIPNLENLILYALEYSARTRAIVGAILDLQNIDVAILKQSLNPFTKYELPIGLSVLPNKDNWNIV